MYHVQAVAPFRLIARRIDLYAFCFGGYNRTGRQINLSEKSPEGDCRMNTMRITQCLFQDGTFHTLKEEGESYRYMGVTDGKISYLGDLKPHGYEKEISLEGAHIYPSMTDGHLHLMYTMVLAADSITACHIQNGRISPDNLDAAGKLIREECRKRTGQNILVANQYIASAMAEKRLPNRQELDDWADGKKIVVYNIDGHSSSMSTALLKELHIYKEGHTGILTGIDHENIQGPVMELIGKSVTPAAWARGVGSFTNLCIKYGIGTVCAMDGNGDEKRDKQTELLAKIASHMEIGVRLYPQFMDLNKARSYRRYQKTPRVGGCGQWEMDGSVGSRSAAFYSPYKDSNKCSDCYYKAEEITEKLIEADAAGFQISSHAIGEKAIDILLDGYDRFCPRRMHRIDHFEFPSKEAVKRVMDKNLALVVQPGFAWMDQYYLKSYKQALTDSVIGQQIPLRTLMENGICICGSSDAPVQSINPFIQMLGMIDYTIPEESLNMYQALCTYTRNPAKMLGEEKELGTLEVGKRANFMVSDWDLLKLKKDNITQAEMKSLYLDGKKCKEKKGTILELARMMAGRKHKI